MSGSTELSHFRSDLRAAGSRWIQLDRFFYYQLDRTQWREDHLDSCPLTCTDLHWGENHNFLDFVQSFLSIYMHVPICVKLLIHLQFCPTLQEYRSMSQLACRKSKMLLITRPIKNHAIMIIMCRLFLVWGLPPSHTPMDHPHKKMALTDVRSHLSYQITM